MTDTTNPGTVTVLSADSAMTFPTADATGAPIPPKAQLDMRMQNPTWVRDAMVPGSQSYAELQRLNVQIAAQASGGSLDAKALAAELRAYGVPEAEIASDLARLGLATDGGKPVEVAPAPTPEPGADPHRFRFPYDDGEPLDADAQALDQAARSWMSAAGFDEDTGSHLAEHVDKLARTASEWTEEDYTAHIERGRAALRKAWGAEFDANVELMDRLLDEVEATRPGLAKFLADTPWLLADPIVAGTILNQAQNRYLRSRYSQP